MKKHGCGQTVPRILIVEDNVAFRRFLREILQTNFPSMKVTEVGDGQEALRQADACTPDLIFIDVRLPGENGLRVTQKVKAAHPESVVRWWTRYSRRSTCTIDNGARGMASRPDRFLPDKTPPRPTP
jgi:DNA-binding NarL/FixJ family response regulator